jgi:glycyl-tRNA synthetase
MKYLLDQVYFDFGRLLWNLLSIHIFSISSEFTLAEIEHFLDPQDKTHPKYETIADLELPLYSAENQTNGESARLFRLRDAVNSSLITSESFAYFMARIYLFLIQIGIDKNRIRFRQHMKNEMSHYATDCWDAECEISTGWIECVGYADRSDYDLSHHTMSSNEQLVAKRKLPAPKQIQVNERKINEKNIGQAFRREAVNVIKYLQNLSENDAQILHEKLQQK